MKRKLRHPIRSITEPYGKAGLLVAILALVLATTGAAFAAAGLNSKQKKEVTAIAKKYAGKPGAPGAQGPAGPAGTNGSNGEKGATGTNGAPGESVTNTAIPVSGTEPKCNHLGGAEFKVGSGMATFACNGAKGPEGNIKSSLPSGMTETGAWSYGPISLPAGAAGLQKFTTISFPIPLAAPLENPASCGTTGPECAVHYINPAREEIVEGATKKAHSAECKGTVAEPSAEPGNLCIYALGPISAPLSLESESNGGIGTFSFEYGASKTGAIFVLIGNNPGASAETAENFGTWALTAP